MVDTCHEISTGNWILSYHLYDILWCHVKHDNDDNSVWSMTKSFTFTFVQMFRKSRVTLLAKKNLWPKTIVCYLYSNHTNNTNTILTHIKNYTVCTELGKNVLWAVNANTFLWGKSSAKGTKSFGDRSLCLIWMKPKAVQWKAYLDLGWLPFAVVRQNGLRWWVGHICGVLGPSSWFCLVLPGASYFESPWPGKLKSQLELQWNLLVHCIRFMIWQWIWPTD